MKSSQGPGSLVHRCVPSDCMFLKCMWFWLERVWQMPRRSYVSSHAFMTVLCYWFTRTYTLIGLSVGGTEKALSKKVIHCSHSVCVSACEHQKMACPWCWTCCSRSSAARPLQATALHIGVVGSNVVRGMAVRGVTPIHHLT